MMMQLELQVYSMTSLRQNLTAQMNLSLDLPPYHMNNLVASSSTELLPCTPYEFYGTHFNGILTIYIRTMEFFQRSQAGRQTGMSANLYSISSPTSEARCEGMH